MANGILNRFKDIMAANVNSMLDKMEDPEKMIDQYLRNMENDLKEVREETAEVMAEDSRMKRKVADAQEEIITLEGFAKKALQAGNEEDARVLIEKRQKLQGQLDSLLKSSEVAASNASKMREMHDKLSEDIKTLAAKKNEIKGKLATAKTAQKINNMKPGAGSSGAGASFAEMEEKINKMVDEAEAMTELSMPEANPVEDLSKKYSSDGGSEQVEEELERMKKELGL